MSCDNIPGNGDVAKKMIVAFARLKDPDLADWMERQVRVPQLHGRPDHAGDGAGGHRAAGRRRSGSRTAWPVVCEPFTQWVLEDRSASAGRPPFEDVGVQLVDDVEPYELMKLRLLNASHQALCYLGYLAGYRYAHEVCQDPLFVDFLLGVHGARGRARRCPTCRGSTSTPTATSSSSGSPTPRCATPSPGCAPRARTASRSGWCPVIRTNLRDGWRDRAVGARGRLVGAVRRGRRRAGRRHRGRRPAQGPGHGRGRAAAGRPAGVPRATATSSATWSTTSGSPTAYTGGWRRCTSAAHARLSKAGGQGRLVSMTDRVLVAGVDSSTQSTKVVVCDADTGEIVRERARAAPRRHRGRPRPRGGRPTRRRRPPGCSTASRAIAVGGQQHGMVALDEAGEVVRDALLWNDTRSAGAAARARRGARRAAGLGRRGGHRARRASITVTKLRWLAEHEPDHAARRGRWCCRTTG